MSPATPAAASRCPTLVLTEPRAQLRRGAPSKARVRASTSMGTPRVVPVPCASTYPTLPGSTPATARDSEITRLWPSMLGAVKPTLIEPSLLIADPRRTARMLSPSLQASANRLRTTTPTPLPPTVPRARTSNARQWPSGDRMPPSWKKYPDRCCALTVAPPARAMSHSRLSRLWQARCPATREVEHAVWMFTLGPWRLSLYD